MPMPAFYIQYASRRTEQGMRVRRLEARPAKGPVNSQVVLCFA
jgi:hypothetical protein